jgi:hypothetical protein
MTASRLPAGMRADLRDTVHILAGLLGCAHDRPLVETKLCGHCKRALPAAQFSRDRHRADGLAGRCRRCNKRYYQARRDRARGRAA